MKSSSKQFLSDRRGIWTNPTYLLEIREDLQPDEECFSDASIANTIRADDREVGDRAEGRYIL